MSEPVPTPGSEAAVPEDLSSSKRRPMLKRSEANVSLTSVISGSPPISSSPPAQSTHPTAPATSTSLANLLSPVNPSQGPVTAFAFIKKSPTSISPQRSTELTSSLPNSSSAKSLDPNSRGSSDAPVAQITSLFGSAGISSSRSGGLREKTQKDKTSATKQASNSESSSASSSPSMSNRSFEIVAPPAHTLSSATAVEWACMPSLSTPKTEPIASIRVSLAENLLLQLKPPPTPLVVREPRWELMPPLTAKFQELWRTKTSPSLSLISDGSSPASASLSGGAVSGGGAFSNSQRPRSLFDLPPPVPSKAHLK